MIHISTFSGLGGGDLAAEWAGWKNYAGCEINEFCNKIRNYYWPKAYHHRDIHTLTYSLLNEEIKKRFGEHWRSEDVVLTGGFPCQGFSVAGKRGGTDDNRYLWPEMLRVCKEIKPTWIVAENVTGILSMEDKSSVWSEVFPKMENKTITRYPEIDHYKAVYSRQAKMLIETICEDLEREGFEVQPIAIPAASVGAPHKRERIWIIGHSKHNGSLTARVRGNEQKSSEQTRENKVREPERANTSQSRTTSHNPGNRMERNRTPGIKITRTSIKSKIPRCNHARNNWQDWPTQPPICSRDDGIPSRLDSITFSKWRNESIKGFGNAWVPQVAYQIFDLINTISHELG